MRSAIEEAMRGMSPRRRLDYKLGQIVGSTTPLEIQVPLREDLLEAACADLESEGIVYLIGQKQMGKSSLMVRLLDHHGQDPLFTNIAFIGDVSEQIFLYVLSRITRSAGGNHLDDDFDDDASLRAHLAERGKQ